MNAANVTNTTPQTLFTNIYIISYNIEAGQETEDIFAKILDNWKFNINLNTNLIGTCAQNTDISCVLNDDCENGDYCLGAKSNTIRDTIRLENIAEIDIALNDYKERTGHYPILSAGSYLPNKSISTWPSWQGTLSQELGVQLPVDPINDLGVCSGYDDVTCWDDVSKEFADSDPTDSALNLPSDSKAFIYQVSPDGASYSFCGEMESGFVSGASGACSGFTAAAGSVGVVVNHAPQIIASNIPVGYAGHPYAGYLQAVDPNNDPITWSINTPGTWTGWSSPPILQFSAVDNHVSIKATSAGDEGVYSFSVTLDDGMGGVTTKSFSIKIVIFPPIINSNPFTYHASSTNPFSGSFTVQGDVLNYPLTPSFTTPLPDALNLNYNINADGITWDFDIFGIFNPLTNTFSNSVTQVVRNLEVADTYGTVSDKDITINVINHPPAIETPLTCETTLRVNTDGCVTPWGALVSEGAGITAYKKSYIYCGETCESETRICSGGSLTGVYTSPSCTIEPCSSDCVLPWGGTIPDGASVVAYEDLNVFCGAGFCNSETRVCDDGNLSGGFTNPNCFDNLCTSPTETCSGGSCGCQADFWKEYTSYENCTWADSVTHCDGQIVLPGTHCENIGLPNEYKLVHCQTLSGIFDVTTGNCCDASLGICDGDLSIDDSTCVETGWVTTSVVTDPTPATCECGSADVAQYETQTKTNADCSTDTQEITSTVNVPCPWSCPSDWPAYVCYPTNTCCQPQIHCSGGTTQSDGCGGTIECSSTPYLFTNIDGYNYIENDIMATFWDIDYSRAKEMYEETPLSDYGFSNNKYRTTDRYILANKPSIEKGILKLNIKELEPEESHIDQIRLVRALYNDQTELIVDNQTNQLRSIKKEKLREVISGCEINSQEIKEECLGEILENDNNSVYGRKNDFIEFEINTKNLKGKNIYLSMNSWGSTPLPMKPLAGKASAEASMSIYFDTEGNGEYLELNQIHPREIETTSYIDISELISRSQRDSLKAKIVWTQEHWVDQISVVISEELEYRLEELLTTEALHSSGEDVLERLEEKDFVYVDTKQGDEIDLEFRAGRYIKKENEKEAYIFVSSGFYNALRPELYPELEIDNEWQEKIDTYVEELNGIK
ncbi:hypothetical protein C0584_05510 [Candidatus Parcubacteria bacterium]|nr:MAG: hypothetical protein C0584_05510 [Candidatus Parcubacteria bacterium]